MKKIIDLFLVLVMILSLTVCFVGCDAGEKGDANTNGDEIILLVDVSDSLNGIKSEVDLFVESVIDSNNGAKIGIVTFGYDQVYAAELSANTTDTYTKYLSAPMPDITATNIADAITYASTLFTRPEKSKIVLISDGAETDANSSHVIKSIAAKGIIVDTVCFAEEAPANEVQIISLQVPDKIVVGESFEAKATIQSSHSGIATVRLFDNGVAGEEMEIELVEGIQTVSISCTLPLPGLHELSVQLVCAEDSLAINNYYSTCVYIQIYDKILIIENIEGESESLRTMLNDELNVSVVNVSDYSNMPTEINELREYEEVILINVANADMPDGFDELLYSYVHDFGGGLFTVCGNKEDGNPNDDMFEANAYTREDMYGTLYQQMLPVEIVDYTPPTAVVIIVDDCIRMLNYNSVNETETRFYYAKQGAMACLDALTERDYIEIMSLSEALTKEFEFKPCTQRDDIISTIENISVDSNAYDNDALALKRAGDALAGLDRVAKRHIIFVTEGCCPIDNYEAYASCFHENNAKGITMSIVGVECYLDYANRMEQMLVYYAGMTSKNCYNITDLSNIQAVIKEDLGSPLLKDFSYETFMLTFGVTDHAVIGNLNEAYLPALDGYYGVKAKEGAEVILVGPYSNPIYTQWKLGLGTVGTFVCDLNGTWSCEFIYSDTGIQLINNIVNNLLPTNDIRYKDIDVVIEGSGYSQTATVTTDLEEGEYIELSVRALSCENEAQTFTADAANVTRFSFSITSAGIHAIIVQKKDESGTLLSESVYYKAFSYSNEYDAFYDRESAAKILANIAKYGNGNVIESPADVFDSRESDD